MTATREPPEMVPSAEERAEAYLKSWGFDDGVFLSGEELPEAVKEAFIDGIEEGWNAARAEIERLERLIEHYEKLTALQNKYGIGSRPALAKDARGLWEQLHGYDPIEAIEEEWRGVHPRLREEFDYITAAITAAERRGERRGLERAAKIADRFGSGHPASVAIAIRRALTPETTDDK